VSCTTIAESTQKAKKEHKCSWCGQQILVGEMYLRSRVVFEGDPQTNKFHPECGDAAAADNMEWGEGFMPYEQERPAKRSQSDAGAEQQ
jgi:hypothetical protein